VRVSRFAALLAPLALPAVLCGSSSPANASTSAAVLLRYHFTVGQTNSYRLTANIKEAIVAGSRQQTITIKEVLAYIQRVNKVYPDGSASIVATYKNATITANGHTQPLPLRATSISVHLSPTGQTNASLSGSTASAFGGSGINIAGAGTFPTAPVAVNDSWTTASAVSLGSLVTGRVKQKSTLVSLSTMNGDRVAQIRTAILPSHLDVAVNGVSLMGNATGSAATHFDVDAGVLNSTHAQVHVPFKGSYQGSDVRIILNETIDLVRTA